jgi:sigma-B regulation protein RsbU (phosphoserine phosphatase)
LSARRQKNKPLAGSGQDRWETVLKLGGQLLASGRSAATTPQSVQLPGFPSPQEKLQRQRTLILQAAESLFGGRASLWLSDHLIPTTPPSSETGTAHQAVAQSQQDFAPPASALMRFASRKGRLSGVPGEANSPRVIRNGTTMEAFASLATPLVAEGPDPQAAPLVLGVLQIDRLQGQVFSAEDVEILKGLAIQAAMALQTDRQLAIERWRIEQLALVRQVSNQIAKVRDVDELARRVTRLILQTFNYYFVAIFTLQPDQDVLHFRHSAGPMLADGSLPKDPIELPSIRLGQGIVGHVAQTGEEVVANDVSQEARYRYAEVLPDTHSEAALPLKIEDQVLGVLDVQSDLINDFQEADMLVLRALAGNVAIAFEGAQLYSRLRRRAEQLAAVAEVSAAITSILDENELLNQVVNLIHERFGYPYVHIFDVHPGRRKVFYKAGSGARSQGLMEQGLAYELDDPLGIITWVARQGETLLANDVEREPRYRPSNLPPANTRAELAVPLIFNQEVLGVLDVQSDQVNAFGEEDRFLFEALADAIAIALRNAALYNSERWRRQVADSLREVAGLLSTDADLNQVLEAILTELDRTLPCDAAAIWLLDEEAQEVHEARPAGRLHLSAVRSDEPSGLEELCGFNVQAVVDHITRPQGQAEPEDLLAFLDQVLTADRPVVRKAQSPYEPLGRTLDFPPDYSAVATPLKVGEQRLGVLALAHRTPGRYGTEARGMAAAFASYAAVAIENTRLYEAAHEQAWISTVLLQVSEATQNLTNLNELLSTVVRITPMLVGVKACALYILDEEQVFIPAFASGLEADQQLEFERWRFAPGDVPAFDRLLDEKSPLLLGGGQSDPLLAAILFSGEQEAGPSEETLALVPLLAHSQVLGAFLVDYSGRSTPRHFDERLAIIQGIAHQTAVAAENVRLLKAQKEEAYVSVALLQVAQVVASSNDLDETLGSIVRLTPILVGVKRVLLFLWEDERQSFYLAQSYGIPRSLDSQFYTAQEFPLLEDVRQQNALLACPLGLEEAHAPSPPEAWTSLSVLDAAQTRQALQASPGDNRLLLAFPLAVKDEVLGVMLVEEPAAVPPDYFTQAGNWRRLREKRLEITTGISQQAAMAIQNDLLQHELVARERLEREFQLAREIQRAFLPHEIPSLQGWELNTRWRTAREVGGDFYDFIHLSGDRLGVVIADVADKGMPAALFMTLMRTLVRATAAEINSPAEVLQRVNDVLLPDAQQGMFVTIFYGVLSTHSGELVYANAGHNPPLLARATTGKIRRLKRSGMALGVEENTQIDERKIRMRAGDFLLLYTDGLTESFASNGEMYGEGRLLAELRRLIRQEPDAAQDDSVETAPTKTMEPSADNILNAVEGSLRAFNGDAPLADDLTLVVLLRSPETPD